MRRRALAVIAALGLVATAMIGVAPAASAEGHEDPVGAYYVALGDSMASGNGNLPYLDPECLRSAKSYPETIGATLGTGVVSAACSGATTTDVGAQIAGLVGTGDLGPATQIVTLTIGINDLGWGPALEACATPGMEQECADLVDQMQDNGYLVVEGVYALLGAIRYYAENATIVVTGYPKLFGEVSKSCSIGNLGGTPVKLPGSLTAMANVAIDGSADANYADPIPGLNDAIAGATGAFAFTDGNTVFIDVDPAFATHRLCDTGDRWISGLVRGAPVADRGLHPNTAGMNAFAWSILGAMS